jgi:ABC-type glycerol-3-phosphate transport system substrate-binding protein
MEPNMTDSEHAIPPSNRDSIAPSTEQEDGSRFPEATTGSGAARPTRRRVLSGLGAAGIAGLSSIAGCVGGGGGGVDLPDEITVVQENVPDTAAIEPLLSKFEEEEGITVNMTKDSYETLQEKISTQLQSNDPDFDVSITDQYWTGDFAEGGLIRSLDDRIDGSDVISADTYFDTIWQAMARYDDTTWGVPFFHYTHTMMYRADVLEDPELQDAYDGELKAPESIEEYVKICEFLTENTRDDFYGAAMQGQRGIPIHDECMDYFHGMGGEFLTADGDVQVTEHEQLAVDALKTYIGNFENGAPEASKGWKFSEALEMLNNGDAFSMLTYNPLYPLLSGADNEVGNNLAIDAVPGGSPPMWGWAWAIPSNVSDGRAEAAWRFIEWVESFDIRKQRMTNGGSPTAPDVLEEQDVVDTNPAFFDKQEEIITSATPWSNVPGTTQAAQNWGTQMSQAVAGNKSPEKAVSDGISQISDALQ